MSPDRGAARAGRVAAFTAAALTLATTAHVAAGGRLDLALLPVLLPLVAGLVDLTAARRRGPLTLLALTGLVQVGTHAALMSGPDLQHTPTDAHMDMAHMDMAMPMDHAAHLAQAPGAAGRLPVDAMTLWHAMAAVALALLLAHGEAALWALAAHLAWTFRLPRPARPVPVAAQAAPVVRARLVPVTRPFLRTVSRRGPPCVPRATPSAA